MKEILIKTESEDILQKLFKDKDLVSLEDILIKLDYMDYEINELQDQINQSKQEYEEDPHDAYLEWKIQNE